MHRLKARIRRQQSRWANGFAICLLSLPVPNLSALAASESLGAVQGERKLVVYHTTTLPDTAAIAQGFKKKYPLPRWKTIAAPERQILTSAASAAEFSRHFMEISAIIP